MAESVRLRHFPQPLPDRSSQQEEPVPGELGARGLAALVATGAAPSLTARDTSGGRDVQTALLLKAEMGPDSRP